MQHSYCNNYDKNGWFFRLPTNQRKVIMIDYSFKKSKFILFYREKVNNLNKFFYTDKNKNRLSYTRVGFLSGFPIPWKNWCKNSPEYPGIRAFPEIPKFREIPNPGD